MLAAAIPPEVQNYWAPVSQIVPVIALSLVFEARRAAQKWREASSSIRRPISIGLFIAAILLATIEAVALGHMARGTSDPMAMRLTTIALVGAMSIVVVSPIQALAHAANIDVFIILNRWWPGSEWRKARKSFEKEEVIFGTVLAGVVAGLDNVERSLAVARKNRREVRTQIAILKGLVSTVIPDEATPAERVRLESIISRARDALPEAERLSDEVKAVYKQTKVARQSHLRALDSASATAERIEKFKAENSVATLTERELEFAREALDKATDQMATDTRRRPMP